MQQRLPPAQPSEEEMAFRAREGSSPPNLQLAISHAPEVARLQLELLRASSAGLSVRDKELMILVVGLSTHNDYCWGHHVALGMAAGISRAEILAIRNGDYDGFPPEDRMLLEFAAAAVSHQVSDALWAEMSKRHTPEELVKIVMLISLYCMLGTVQAVLKVPQDEGFGGFEQPLD